MATPAKDYFDGNEAWQVWEADGQWQCHNTVDGFGFVVAKYEDAVSIAKEHDKADTSAEKDK